MQQLFNTGLPNHKSDSNSEIYHPVIGALKSYK